MKKEYSFVPINSDLKMDTASLSKLSVPIHRTARCQRLDDCSQKS